MRMKILRKGKVDANLRNLNKIELLYLLLKQFVYTWSHINGPYEIVNLLKRSAETTEDIGVLLDSCTTSLEKDLHHAEG